MNKVFEALSKMSDYAFEIKDQKMINLIGKLLTELRIFIEKEAGIYEQNKRIK